MIVEYNQVNSADKEKAVIYATKKTPDIVTAMELLEGNSGGIPVISNGVTYLCKPGNIYYIESVDKKSFLYTKDGCYETKYRLYELEEMLGRFFVRCSKAMIVNLRKIKTMKSDIGGRMETTLLNDEHINYLLLIEI